VLYWRADGPTAAPLTVSVRLVARDGRVVAQHDAPPARGVRPTDAWRAGEVVVDAYDLKLDPLAPPGTLDLVVRLYDPVDGEVRGVGAAGRGRAVENGAALTIGTIDVDGPATTSW